MIDFLPPNAPHPPFLPPPFQPRTHARKASGYGTVPPGSKMTYDSENYIQHISYTLSTIAKKKGMAGAYEYVGRKPPLATKNLLEVTDGCGSPLVSADVLLF